MLKNRRFPEELSLKKACELLKVSRSTVYYREKGESKENQRLMEEIEEIYAHDPATGYRRMRAMLKRRTEKPVNHKRVRRLMRLMGLRGIAPAPKTTRTAYTDYSNLLKDFQVTRPNQVWCADISYIRVKGGFAYGVAIMDLYSRKVLSFEISNTMDEYMCIEAAEKALSKYGPTAMIHTDRGKQFLSKRFTALFEDTGAKISVGERGFKDNIVMERFWRSYKWEFVYLMEKMDLKELKKKTKQWVEYYNRERPHQSLDYKTPDEVYYGKEYNKVAV